MNFAALDIIHFWSDSRGKLIKKVVPTNREIRVYCNDDLSMEAVKVCHFLNLIVKQPWTFQTVCENEQFVITFLLEKISLERLFQIEYSDGATKKPPRKERKRGG